MKYLLGLDNGGTFCKAALFNTDGQQIALTSRPTALITPAPGYTERNMNEVWEMCAGAIRELIENSGIDPLDIAGVSFSGHGKGLYLVGYDGKPSYNGILSTDTRAWEYVKGWNEDGTKEKVFTKSFQSILACQPVSLLAWLKDHKPEVLEDTKYVFMINDYIRFCLTGEAYAEYSSSSGGNLINLSSKAYDRELLEYFGLEEVFEKLPPLKNSYDICGYVTEAAATECGLCPGTPVAAGMFDVNACGVATGLVDEGKMCMVAGTWSINEYIAKEPVLNGTVELNSLFCIPEYYLIEESSPTSAGNLEWFINQFMEREKKEAKEKGISIYDIANEWVGSIDPMEFPVIFLPFLHGSNEDPLSKASWIGLTAFHKKRDMLRAVYEGIVFSHLSHVKRLLANREKPESIRLSGGASKSDIWVQIFADALQVPIDVVEGIEAGALGAAMSAGIAAGLFSDYKEAADKMVKIGKRVYPQEACKEVYEKRYQAYRSVINGLSESWALLKN